MEHFFSLHKMLFFVSGGYLELKIGGWGKEWVSKCIFINILFLSISFSSVKPRVFKSMLSLLISQEALFFF